jgi:hypothetical protein
MRFVCWLWKGHGFWKNTAAYDARDVEVLASMLKRHGGHDLTCITDGRFDLPKHIDQIVMPAEVAALPDYQPKIWAWSPELHDTIGERFASIDLDVVLLGDPALESVWGTPPILLWDEAVDEPYNTSLFFLEPGHGQEVWGAYSPEALVAARSRRVRWTGDQSWVAYILGSKQPTFSEKAGIIRFRGGKHQHGVPLGTRAVFFCGPISPRVISDDCNWVREEWR